MPLFLDASALVKRYLPEGRSSQNIKDILGRSRLWGGLAVSNLVLPEVVSAMGAYVRKCVGEQKRQARSQHVRMARGFREEYERGSFNIVRLTDDLLMQGTSLLERHPEWAIGGADALHLASALALRKHGAPPQPLVFVTSDQWLYEAAKQSGLAVLNPNFEGLRECRALFPPPEEAAS